MRSHADPVTVSSPSFPLLSANKPLGYCSVAMTGISSTRAAWTCANIKVLQEKLMVMASPSVEPQL